MNSSVACDKICLPFCGIVVFDQSSLVEIGYLLDTGLFLAGSIFRKVEMCFVLYILYIVHCEHSAFSPLSDLP